MHIYGFLVGYANKHVHAVRTPVVEYLFVHATDEPGWRPLAVVGADTHTACATSKPVVTHDDAYRPPLVIEQADRFGIADLECG